MTVDVTVIVPTHNPRTDYMERVLNALRMQTLDRGRWDLVFVDNRSDRKLCDIFDLSWHPNAVHVREDKLGLTPARLAGISQANAEIVVMVDDDNVLSSDYLETTLRLSAEYPFVGVWGGQVFGEYEDPNNYYARKFPACFTVRSFNRNSWTNRKDDYAIMPIGAGLCARRAVLERYKEICTADPRRQILDRTGERLLTCGDLDIVFTACDVGLGKGLFHELKLTHLIPKKRLCAEFIFGNAEGNQYSASIQNFLLQGAVPSVKRTTLQKAGRIYRLLRANPIERGVTLAEERGKRQAVSDMLKWGWIHPKEERG